MTSAATEEIIESKQAPAAKTDRTRFSTKLYKAIKASDTRMSPFRVRRTQMLRTFLGPYYGTTGTPEQTQPLATIWGFVTSLLPSLMMWEILVDGDSTIPAMRRPSLRVGQATTAELKAMHAGQTYGEILLDAFFGPGLSKIGMARGPMGDTADFTDWRQDPDRVFWRRFSLDDYILDPRCRRREEAQFEGDKFIIVQEDAEKHGYDKAILAKLADLQMKQVADSDSARSLSGPGYNDDDPLYKEWRFADVWLSRENVIATIAVEDGAESFGFLDEQEWDGPEGGPYDMLAFKLPPDNPIPVTPVEQELDPHEVQNTIARKIAEEARDAKTVWGYGVGARDEAGKLASAANRTMVPMSDPKAVQAFTFPGPAADLYHALDAFREMANRNGPNVDLVGGLSTDQKTLGQTQLLFGQAGGRLNEMKLEAQRFLTRVARRVAYYVWNRDTEIPLVANIAGMPVPTSWGEHEKPDPRIGDFLDVAFDVNVYTMGLNGPEQQYQRSVDILTRVVAPLMPQAMAMGIYVDIPGIVEQLSRQANVRTESWFRPGPTAQPGATQSATGGQAQGGTTNISTGGAGARPMPQQSPTTGDMSNG